MELLCRSLEVSRSGYYEWLHRKDSAHMQQDQALKRRMLALHQRYPALGLDSLYHMIRKELSCSRKRVYKTTTNSRHAHPIAPNLLARHFSFDKPDMAWVGDITYIPTDEGWLYCAIVKDLCTKQIVGYAFSDRLIPASRLMPSIWLSGAVSLTPALSSTPTAASNTPPTLTVSV